MIRIDVQTINKKQVVDITGKIKALVQKASLQNGFCILFVLHTTACISTADLDPGTDQDMIDALGVIIPKLKFRHPHDPDHAPDHILSSIIGPSLILPVENKSLVLGTWQRVVLVELNGPKKREIVVNFLQNQ